MSPSQHLLRTFFLVLFAVGATCSSIGCAQDDDGPCPISECKVNEEASGVGNAWCGCPDKYWSCGQTVNPACRLADRLCYRFMNTCLPDGFEPCHFSSPPALKALCTSYQFDLPCPTSRCTFGLGPVSCSCERYLWCGTREWTVRGCSEAEGKCYVFENHCLPDGYVACEASDGGVLPAGCRSDAGAPGQER